MVLLHHDLPDGTSHIDWLIDRHPLDASGTPPQRDISECSLLALRCPGRPDAPAHAAFEAEVLRNHRRLYLAYEGELSGTRGRVRRIARGTTTLSISRNLIELAGYFGPPDAPWGPCVVPAAGHTHRWRLAIRESLATVSRA